jgi:hypothetical protein
MHTIIDYTNRPTKAFDAVEDVKAWFGPRWDEVSALMRTVTNPLQFSVYADFSGVSGYPVEAWYDLYHGEGSYLAAWKALENPTDPAEGSPTATNREQ